MALRCGFCDYFNGTDRSYDENNREVFYCSYHSCYVGRYEDACSHYSGQGGSSSGGSLLTSACVEYLGKPDDCEELTALRNFRDTYMQSTEEGKKLVDEYYVIAPKIVEKINASDKKELYYRYISQVIDKCVCLIKHNELEKTLNEYKSMVLFLKKEAEL